MTKVSQLTTLLLFAATAAVVAQKPTHMSASPSHVKGAAPATKGAETRGAESAEHLKSFRGIAAKLSTTPEALQTAYEQAKATNPKLTRGQFIAANMLGQNLSDKGITTDKILAGLASGKSMTKTLKGLAHALPAREPGQDLVGRDPFVAQVLAQHVGGDELTTRELGVRRSRLLISGLQCFRCGVQLCRAAAEALQMFRRFCATRLRPFGGRSRSLHVRRGRRHVGRLLGHDCRRGGEEQQRGELRYLRHPDLLVRLRRTVSPLHDVRPLRPRGGHTRSRRGVSA